MAGNSASGQRDNNRQIDLRGAGPENTLILIDGMPSASAIQFATDGGTIGIPGETVTGSTDTYAGC